MPKKKAQGLRFNKGKPDFNFIPKIALEVLAKVMELGFAKYGYNWETGQDWATPLACMRRHCADIAEGEWYDKESGLPHAGHVMANAMMLLYFYYHNLGTNNIVARSPRMRELPDISEKVNELNDKYKDKKLNLSPPLMEVEPIKEKK